MVLCERRFTISTRYHVNTFYAIHQLQFLPLRVSLFRVSPHLGGSVFDKFYKVPESGPSRSGTGLGLAISKDFITTQGGRIWVESEIGKGSTFNFELNIV